MPELPEVETIRRGLATTVVGAKVNQVQVRRARSVRHQPGGAVAFHSALVGQRLASAERRGKFLWLPLAETKLALLAHLGMSGQLLVRDLLGGSEHPEHRHLRVRLELDDARGLDFVDQRVFGYLTVADLVSTSEGDEVPAPMRHIARDLLDPLAEPDQFVAAIQRRRTDIKRALLDQRVVSGIGNIYADEALWRARVPYDAPIQTLSQARIGLVLDAAREVMLEAVAAGGTSFDELYVNVTGESGFFARDLAVYGREDEPCLRCGAPIRRARFMNRSAHFCAQCQF